MYHQSLQTEKQKRRYFLLSANVFFRVGISLGLMKAEQLIS